MDNEQVASGDMQESAPVEQTVVDAVAPVAEPAPVAEKMIPQSKMSEAIKLAKRDAEKSGYEKARQELYAQQQQAQQAPSQAQGLGGMGSQSPEDVRRMIHEEAWRMSRDQRAQQIAQEFDLKVEAAKDADPDFAIKYGKLKLEQHPELILWTNSLENTTDVLKDLADSPSKVANVLMLAKSGFGELAQEELKKLSVSIKANQVAQQQPTAKEPLSQISPSSIGADNGAVSVADYRKMFRG